FTLCKPTPILSFPSLSPPSRYLSRSLSLSLSNIEESDQPPFFHFIFMLMHPLRWALSLQPHLPIASQLLFLFLD
ncbi:unnamed protein product, partial [Prunus brigantina]